MVEEESGREVKERWKERLCKVKRCLGDEFSSFSTRGGCKLVILTRLCNRLYLGGRGKNRVISEIDLNLLLVANLWCKSDGWCVLEGKAEKKNRS